MDASDIFHMGFGSAIPRPPPQTYTPRRPPPPHHNHHQRGGDDESDGSSHRIAHTLTACCRCRQRKTRCDPTLPRCLPCERSGSTCEYYDTTKNKKISRSYVVRLQEKVRQLESELAQYTEDDEFPRNLEDIVRPGGLVRLNEADETPRYLGPSSGIAMTRLLMEEAKRYTDSKRISELIPEVRARRLDRFNRMQSVISLGGSISGPSARKKSYPMISAHPAQSLPTRQIADRLVEVFNTRAQVFTPTLHEPTFSRDLQEVYDGSADPYKNFVVRMVMAISLQKLDTQYAGLADSYYLAAMQQFEDVIRPKDLRTLQCLVLIGQYSLLTPTRTNVYHIIGLATRICQQLAIADEKTIAGGFDVDALTLDMRRRLMWIVTSMELGFAYTMGRPNGFAKGDDLIDVGFFATVDDKHISEQGIEAGPPCEKKLVAIHYCKMRLCQSEIRRTLYENKRLEPCDESHPWFAQMEQKIKNWLGSVPEEPAWCKPWFTGRYHAMVVFLFRPSPQVPRPSPTAALKCYESSSYIINLGSQQVKKAAIDITWIFLLTMYMSLNAVLWSASYPEVRQAHSREELEELVNVALDVLDQCSERWPGASAASQLYSIFAKACMQSYDGKDEPLSAGGGVFTGPPSLVDPNSPSASENSVPRTISDPSTQAQQQQPMFSTPQFGYVFSPVEPATNSFHYDDPIPQPQFRSGSIFLKPSSNEPTGRRFSYFPPDAPPLGNGGDTVILEEETPPATRTRQNSQASLSVPSHIPTPPESLHANALSPPVTVISSGSSPTPTMPHASPVPLMANPASVPPPHIKFEAPQTSPQGQPTPQQTPQLPNGPSQRTPTFTIPPLPQHAAVPGAPQRPLPTTVTDWFSPPPPFISPYAFSGMSGPGGGGGGGGPAYLPDPSSTFSGLGLGGGDGGMPVGGPGGGGGGGAAMNGLPGFNGMPFVFPGNPERQGSLSQEQQMELMDVLETEGMGEIDTFLNLGIGLGGVDGGVRWE